MGERRETGGREREKKEREREREGERERQPEGLSLSHCRPSDVGFMLHASAFLQTSGIISELESEREGEF